jgi:hypothetical protein
MKTLLCIPLLLCASAWADEAADRAAIGRLVAALNTSQDTSSLFIPGAENEMPRIADPEPRQPWSETTKPALVLGSVRFITPDVALADAVYGQYGSTIIRRYPLLLVVKREGQEWRIASLRLLRGSPPGKGF